ncbi:probable ATP-dependent DNA helicase HFM1, partial [Python bivittatus]|uniref:Probable ATP-dependent DNA helicase HFM1 n=1 Tax=Python bivittatus TaxID=176946 RepID=A0A9F2REE4_PYTBI
ITLSNAMMNAGLTSFKRIEDTNARELELILNRHPPFGNQIKESVAHLPKYELNIEQLAKYNETVAEIIVTIILTNFEQLQIKRTAPDSHYATLVIGDNDNHVIFRQRIMDSALMKFGNWAKKIEVRRAVNSDELSINLISSEYVGLDIQQKYTPFYLGPKKVGNQIMNIHGKFKDCYSSDSYHTSSVGSSKLRTISIKNGNRKCNHHCKNKEICGHDCCKIGVSEKSNMKNESAFSSYLTDLRNRNAESAIPPVKRLKMQMSNKSQKVDLKQYSYIPKGFLPALPRLEYVQHPRSPSLEEVYSSNVCQGFQVEPEVCKMNGFFAIKHSDEKNNQTMSLNKSLEESLMSNLTDADKSISLFSEPLNVNFELGNEIWDDYDDGSLVHGSVFTANLQKSKDPDKMKPDICLQNSYSPSLTPPSSTKLLAEYGNQNIFRFQEEYNPPEKLKMAQLTTTSETPLRSYQVAGKGDFFISNRSMMKRADLRHQFSDDGDGDGDDDIKPFLGIFDGIF